LPHNAASCACAGTSTYTHTHCHTQARTHTSAVRQQRHRERHCALVCRLCGAVWPVSLVHAYSTHTLRHVCEHSCHAYAQTNPNRTAFAPALHSHRQPPLRATVHSVSTVTCVVGTRTSIVANAFCAPHACHTSVHTHTCAHTLSPPTAPHSAQRQTRDTAQWPELLHWPTV
jgi:hypothetical protein